MSVRGCVFLGYDCSDVNKDIEDPFLLDSSQAKRTRKVGIVGKYGTRYGASLRKMVKKMEITQHAKYTCTFCGKVGSEVTMFHGSGMNPFLSFASLGCHEAFLRRNLVLQAMQARRRRRCLGVLDHCGRLGALGCPSSA